MIVLPNLYLVEYSWHKRTYWKFSQPMTMCGVFNKHFYWHRWFHFISIVSVQFSTSQWHCSFVILVSLVDVVIMNAWVDNYFFLDTFHWTKGSQCFSSCDVFTQNPSSYEDLYLPSNLQIFKYMIERLQISRIIHSLSGSYNYIQ